MDNTPEGGNEIVEGAVHMVFMWPFTAGIFGTVYMAGCIALAMPFFAYPTRKGNPDE